MVHFCNLNNLPKVNKSQIGENSPNLVTLMGSLWEEGKNQQADQVKRQVDN
jgi:hypothetical protein